ncbi:SubName: Full=Uncharacterized protein {ECO:0000313/EMBL:CCA70844.1} [Serendipita indica DSM 11827]|nr:SubName: Full=Uncharacterized protein {ECO:0000313/EMBL:CCA70844.1} [Serendipita indica DSM 11827]
MAAAIMASFSAVNEFMDEEASVNAMWNGVFNAECPTGHPGYMTAPEVHSLNGRADLIVYQIGGQAPHLTSDVLIVFEGKRRTGDDFPVIVNQCKNWARSVLSQHACCYFIGARGKLAKFWVCQRIGNGQQMWDLQTKSLRLGGHNQFQDGQPDMDDGTPFDLTNGIHRALIINAFTYMRNHVAVT